MIYPLWDAKQIEIEAFNFDEGHHIFWSFGQKQEPLCHAFFVKL